MRSHKVRSPFLAGGGGGKGLRYCGSGHCVTVTVKTALLISVLIVYFNLLMYAISVLIVCFSLLMYAIVLLLLATFP